MPNDLVDNEEFLARLTRCFESTKASGEGTVWLTHKRYTYQPTDQDAEMEALNETENTDEPGPSSREYDVLIRCTDGKDINFSSRIPPSLLPTFHASYGSLLKAAMAPQMRKRDKKKEKQKLEMRIKMRRELYEDVDFSPKIPAGGTGEGGEGGAKRLGHRQRKRKILAQQKKETERAKLEEKEKEESKRGVVGL